MGPPPPAPPRSTSAPAPHSLVGRERELDQVRELLSAGDGQLAVLVLEGEPGIGKTSLWEAGLALGAERGHRVLTARASEAENGLPLAAVIDLLDGVTDEELASLPRPQRHALKVALYREEPVGPPAEPQAIWLGLLTALRSLAQGHKLLVAVDDVQWLDRASDDALAYAVRRLAEEPVTLLLARRPGERSALEGAVPGEGPRQVPVVPLSLGATRHMLADRVGLRLPHHVLRRVVDTTLGNPLFALEVGRVLAERDPETLGEDLPVPDHVEDLVGLRIADLGHDVRQVLLALALDGDLRTDQLRIVEGPGGLERALEEGVVVADGERIRAAHPLLAAAAKRHASDAEIRDVHRRLAGVVTHEQSQVLHLAVATTTEEENLASRAAAAAAAAANRGAPRLAVDLGTHALRLTPPDSPASVSRLLDLGRYLIVAGERHRVTDLLADRVDHLPEPVDRVLAHLLLMQGVVRGNDDIRAHLEAALEEAGDDDGLRAQVLVELAENDAVVRVEQVERAERWAAEAVDAGGATDAHRHAVTALAWARALRGSPVADLSEAYRALPGEHVTVSQRPDRIGAQRLVWRGEVEEARKLLTSLRTEAEERGQPSSYALVRLHLCELELRIGDTNRAQVLLDDWGASADNLLLNWPMYERCHALLAAVRGDPDGARQWARTTLDRVDATGVRWDWLEAQRALGMAALLGKDARGAVELLGVVWDHTEREGAADPGAFPVAPDLVEALVTVDDLDRARQVATRLAELGRAQEHPWALAGAARCAATIALATAYDDETADALSAAAGTYRDLGLAFDEARTLLVLGRARRRARQWGGARDTLEQAAAAFDAIGSSGWAAEARSELSRVGARRPTSPGLLTATEGRVAALAMDGLSNKEIARSLVVTVNTVEFHLRNVYAKLGIRSRMHLAVGLERAGADPPD
jgi:DNA-binding CsgD family transcriptional regulator